jgi:hypothetical protein
LGTNPQCIDTDGDGLSDHFERYTSGFDNTLFDTDSDNVGDFDEHLRGTNPAAADTDGDGISDFDEHIAGTDPTNSED